MKRNFKRKVMVGLLSACLIFQTTGIGNVYATETTVKSDTPVGTSSACTHHTHDAECSYTEGAPCNREHAEDCSIEVETSVHAHTAECYPAPDSQQEGSEGEQASDAEKQATDGATNEPTECSHSCDEASGCITKELDYKHQSHDADCGYTEGTPCTFDLATCEDCNPKDNEPAPEEEEAQKGNCVCEPVASGEGVHTNEKCPYYQALREEKTKVEQLSAMIDALSNDSVLQEIYATDSDIKPVIKNGQTSESNRPWTAYSDGGIQTGRLYGGRHMAYSCLKFDVPDDAYYEISFQVRNYHGSTSAGSAGGYILDIHSNQTLSQFKDWGYGGSDLGDQFIWESDRTDATEWTTLTTKAKRGGSVTLMAGIIDPDGSLKPEKCFISFRNLKVTRLTSVLNVDTSGNGTGTFDVAFENPYDQGATGVNHYSEPIGRGTSVTLKAHPAAGSYLDKWVDGSGAELSRNITYTFTPTADSADTTEKIVKAVFTSGADSRVTTMLDDKTLNLLNETNVSLYENGGWIFDEKHSPFYRGAYTDFFWGSGGDGFKPKDKDLSYLVNVPKLGNLYATFKLQAGQSEQNRLTVLVDGVEVFMQNLPSTEEQYFHTNVTAGVHIITFKATVHSNGYSVSVCDLGVSEVKETTLAEQPTVPEVEYGTALIKIPITGGKVVTTDNVTVPGKWGWTDAFSPNIFPVVDGKVGYEAEFTPTSNTYQPVTIKIIPKITVKTVTVTPNSNQTVEYGATPELEYALSYEEARRSIKGALALDGKDIGPQIISQGTLAIKNNPNYTLVFSEAPVTATITPKPVELTWMDSSAFTYDGTAKTITATVNNPENGETVTVGSYATNVQTNAGDYTASALTLNGANKGNYTLEGSATAINQWSIAKKAVSDTNKNGVTIASIDAQTYTGGEIKPAVTVQDGDKTLTDADYDVTYNNNINAGTNAAATVNFKGNYSGSLTQQFAITKVESIVTPETTNKTVAYGEPLTLTATVARKKATTFAAQDKVEFVCGGTLLGTADVSYSDDTNSKGTAQLEYDTSKKGLVIGDNTITALYGGSVNLNGSESGTITVNLEKKMVTAVAETITKEFDKTNSATVNLTIPDKIAGDEVTPTATATYASVNVGTDIGITLNNTAVGGAQSEYYDVTFPTLTGSIIAKPITVDTITVLSKTYDGKTDATITDITFTNLENGDSLVYGTDMRAKAAFTAADVGTTTVNVTEITLTSTAAKNYSLTENTATTVSSIDAADFEAMVTIASTDENSNGKLDEGDVLTASVNGLSGVLAYQWKIGEENVRTNSNTYTMEADKTGYITCVVTSTGNVVGTKTSNVLEIGKTPLTGTVTITGDTTVGATLILDTTGITPADADYDILWSDNSTEETYTVTQGDLGKTITVTITGMGDYSGALVATETIPSVAPDIPVITAVAGDRKVTVLWKTPFDGGSALTGYTLTVSPGAGSLSIAPDAISYEVTNLTNSTEYTFTLVASNEKGNSGRSNEATATPEGMNTVNFDTNGGSAIDPIQVVTGRTIVLPAPTKSGYNFVGWYTDAGLTTAFSDVTPINTDITLYAKWTVRDSGGGSGGSGTVNNKPVVTTDKGGTANIDKQGNVIITPDQDYQIGKIIVNGKEISIPANGKLTGLTAGDKVHITFEKIILTPTTPANERFIDVPANAWFAESVQFAVDNGLFAGTSDTSFSPNAPMTRAMLWTVLYRHAGATAQGEGGTWYANALAWAKKVGISDGTNAEGEITREQLVTILWRYTGSPKANGDLSKFSDDSAVADYAKTAMAWAVENGIVAGADGKLMPTGNATRAQVAAILMRYCQNVAK